MTRKNNNKIISVVHPICCGLAYALKTPQPWPDKQDEQLRETFLQKLKQLMAQPQVDIWFADESGFEGDPRPQNVGTKREEKPA